MWIKVTNDKYELPVAVGETAVELAEMLGVTTDVIYSSVSHFKAGRIKKSLYLKIEEGDEDASD